MKSWQSGTRYMLGVLNGTFLHIHELVVSVLHSLPCPWCVLACLHIQNFNVAIYFADDMHKTYSFFSLLWPCPIQVTDVYGQPMRYVQQLSLEEEIISWKSYRAGAWDYLLLASRNLVRVFVQLGTYYEPLQDLLPAAGMTHFEGIMPVSVRFFNAFIFSCFASR